MEAEPLVLLVGNPNVGKTSLFNALTGARARVGNYPGVTVERRSGRLRLPDAPDAELVDIPGTYSLSARSPEEQLTLDAVLGQRGSPQPSLIVVVLDAGQLARNLYLLLQLAELRIPLVVALNMIDEALGGPPSAPRLASELGVPVIGTNARDGEGVDELRAAIAAQLRAQSLVRIEVDYPTELQEQTASVMAALPAEWQGERAPALARWALTSLDDDDELTGVPPGLRVAVAQARDAARPRDLDQEIIQSRYELLDAISERVAARPQGGSTPRPLSERIDRVLLHPVLGSLSFVLVMLVVFQALFSWSDPAIGVIERGVSWCQRFAANTLPDGVLRDLLVEGILGGVGNVVVFLPQILLLFLFLGLLEDSGYMARVAYLMDRLMKAVGLNGRAFIPMLGGFACAVPAIMATRTMERERDRILTMLVIPLTTCSARLPVYTLVIAALFPPGNIFGVVPVQGLLMVAMYLFGLTSSLLAAAVLGRVAVKGRRVPLLLELPPYRRPKLTAVLRVMVDKAFLFLKEAGTVIAAFTILLWALLSFPAAPPPEPGVGAEQAQAQALERSFAGQLGKTIEPAIQPLGFDWKIGVGLIGAFAAREVFVSTMALVYGVGAVDEDDPAPLRERMRDERRADGRSVYTPLTGLSLMVFFALACQCMSTLAAVKRETRGWRWPAFLFGYMTLLAWVASFIVYQGGRLLGFA